MKNALLSRGRVVLLLLLLAGCTPFLSAQLRSLRYWFDGDQSTQRHTAFAYTSSDRADLVFDTNGIGIGLHTITMQAERANGKLSPTVSAIFVKSAKQDIADKGRIRIWIDNTDTPPITKDLPPTSSIYDLSILVKNRHLSQGLHTVFMQYIDGNGYPSPIVSASFAYFPQSKNGKATLHAWIDSVKGNPIFTKEVNSSTMIIPLEEINKKGIKGGLHTIYMQYVGANGALSPMVSHYFAFNHASINGKGKLHAWIDSLKGKPIFTKEIDKNTIITPFEEINTKGVNFGIHTLYMQYEDVYGSPSPLVSALFIKSRLGSTKDPYVGVSYWFDNDRTTAKEQLFSSSDANNEIHELSLSARHIANGKHLVTIGLLTKSGIIGQSVSDSIEVASELPTSVQITTLSPDPNSLIKKNLTRGAILTFYYRIVDQEHRPVEGATVKALFGSKELTSTVSDSLGVVAIEIDTDSKGIKPNNERLNIGDKVQYKLSSATIGANRFNEINPENKTTEYRLAYERIPNSFEITLAAGGTFSPHLNGKKPGGKIPKFGQAYEQRTPNSFEVSPEKKGGNKWDPEFSLGAESNGKLKLIYNPDGSIKSFSSGSGVKVTPKIKPGLFIKDFSVFGQNFESIEGDPTPGNSLVAIDRLSRGSFLPIGIAGYIYTYALNRYLKKHRKEVISITEEQHGWVFGGKASLKKDYSNKFEPFKIMNWVSMIDLRGIHFSGALGLKVKPPVWSYKGSSLEELKDYREPYGEYKLSLGDISLENDGIMVKWLKILNDGNPNVFSNRLFLQSTKTQMDFSFKHNFTASPHFRHPINLKTGYSFSIKYPWSLTFKEIKGHKDKAKVSPLSISPKLTWKNSVSSEGVMLGLIYQLGDETQRRSTIPSIKDMGIWDLWGFLSCFTNQERSIQDLWRSVKKRSKGKFEQKMADLKEGYKISPSIEMSTSANVTLPITPWFTLKQDVELIMSYKTGDSYFHIQANRLVRPIRYEKIDLLLHGADVVNNYAKGISDLLDYCKSSWDLYNSDVNSLSNDGWDKGKVKKKGGWTYVSSSDRSIDEDMLNYNRLRSTSFNDKSQVVIAYKNDNSIFDEGTEVNLISRFTAGQVYGVTAKGDSLLLIGDLFRVIAQKDGQSLTNSKSPFKIKAFMGADDLRFFGLPTDTPLSLYHIAEDTNIWEPVGDLGKEHFVSKLGYYAMGCKFESDTIPPTITIVPDLKEGYIDVSIKDNFALNSDRMGAAIDGNDVESFSLKGDFARIHLSEEQLHRDSLSLYVFAVDVAGNAASGLFEIVNSRPSGMPSVTSEGKVRIRYEKTQDVLSVDITPALVGQTAYLYDISGALYKIFPLNKERSKYSVANLQPGVYILKIDGIGYRFMK